MASPQGNQRITPLQLIQRARTLRPDAVLLASDCHTGGSEAERGRERKAVWRSVRWLKEQMHALYGGGEAELQGSEADDSGGTGERKSKRQRRAERQEEAGRRHKKQSESAAESGDQDNQAGESALGDTLSADSHVKPPYIIAPVPLTTDTVLQQACMQDISSYSHLVDGFSIAISPANCDASLSALPSVLSQLPASSLRICSSHPPSLSSLFAIACSSVDLVSTALPYHHSLLGLALSLHEPALSLHSASLATSALPLAIECRCYTCAHHTRAYVHHLLRVKEMTATVLLDLHNTHTVLELMRIVRDRLAAQHGVEGWQEWRDHWLNKLKANERVERSEQERQREKETADARETASDKFAASDKTSRSEAPTDVS